MTMLLIALATIAAEPAAAKTEARVDEAQIRAFALAEATKRVGEILKNPAGAHYAVKEARQTAPSRIYPNNRYVVTGYVDGTNSYGATIREDWTAIVLVPTAGPPALWGLLYAPGTTKSNVLYFAPPAPRFDPEVYNGVRKEFAAVSARYRHQIERLPVRARERTLERYTREFIATAQKKYGLTTEQALEIIKDGTP